MSLARRLIADRRGGVAIMSAAFGMALCALAAVAVDLGSLALKARQVQGAADLAALSAVAHLNEARSAAVATARDNAGSEVEVELTLGRYAAAREISPATRFTPVASLADTNAVRVEVQGAAPLFFGRWILGREVVPVRRSATAALKAGAEPAAAFSIGSRLASVDGGIANALLSGLTGSQVSLTAMDYDALLDADVDLLSFIDGLASEMEVTAGDYDAVLAGEVEAGAALGVLETLLSGRAGQGVGRIAEAAGAREVALDRLFGGEAAAIAGLEASVSALSLATALLEVSNGDRQVALDLGARAGLADLDVDLAIGERPNASPWLTVTDKGAPIVRTAQTRLMIRARTAQALSGLARVDLPILIEAAASEARLDALTCEGARSVALDVRPGLARAWIGAPVGDLDDFKTPLDVRRASLLSVPLVSITGRADVEAADAAWTRVRFAAHELDGATVKSVRTGGALTGVVGSLLGRLDLDVKVAGLGLGLGGLAGSLGALLQPLGPVLDGVVNPVLDLLGVRLGEADVTVNGLRCPDPRDRVPALVG